MKNKILIIDGNSLFFRSYYATSYPEENIMRTSNGIAINAVYTFTKLIHSIVRQTTPSHLFIAFDKGSKTKRHQKYKEYKGKRSKTPEELISQISIVQELLTLLEICWYQCDDWEADDILATIAKKESAKNNEVLIMSSDRDLLQLVDENTSFLINKKGVSNIEVLNYENFYEKIGVYPQQIPDYKGLVGDTSDNLPGVMGIGPKGAIKLLTQYKSLSNIYKCIDEIQGKTKEKLINSRDNAFLSYEMAIINTKVDIPEKYLQYKYSIVDNSNLANFYEKYEMNTFLYGLDSEPKKIFDRIIF